jgi:hypothetical protein
MTGQPFPFGPDARLGDEINAAARSRGAVTQQMGRMGTALREALSNRHFGVIPPRCIAEDTTSSSFLELAVIKGF